MLQRHRIFRRQRSGSVQPRHDTERTPSRVRFDRVDSRAEQLHFAAKLVDDEPTNALAIPRVEHRMRADQRRNHVAAIDVADEHDRHVCRVRETHVRDVVRAQVRFRRAAGAFDDDDIGFTLQPAEAVERDCSRSRDRARNASACRVSMRRPRTMSCAAMVRLRLEQHRIHVDGRRRPARQRLQCRGAADLAAVAVTAALFDMFCGLKGRTTLPRFVSNRHSPATSSDLPTSEPQPWIISAATTALRQPTPMRATRAGRKLRGRSATLGGGRRSSGRRPAPNSGRSCITPS